MVQLNCDRSDLENALILTGNYDPSLDQLARLMREEGRVLYPRYTGNLEAVQALRKNICHAAPLVLHACDTMAPLPRLFHSLQGLDLILVGIAAIPLGIISREGIDLNQLSMIRFINQEKGSMARQVLDELIEAWNISPAMLSGYDQEVKSHQAVAGAIRNGSADAGIASVRVAEESGLTFTPLSVERYSLAFRNEQFADDRVRALADMIRSSRFRDALTGIGGYDLRETGIIRTLRNGSNEIFNPDLSDPEFFLPGSDGDGTS